MLGHKRILRSLEFVEHVFSFLWQFRLTYLILLLVLIYISIVSFNKSSRFPFLIIHLAISVNVDNRVIRLKPIMNLGIRVWTEAFIIHLSSMARYWLVSLLGKVNRLINVSSWRKLRERWQMEDMVKVKWGLKWFMLFTYRLNLVWHFRLHLYIRFVFINDGVLLTQYQSISSLQHFPHISLDLSQVNFHCITSNQYQSEIFLNCSDLDGCLELSRKECFDIHLHILL